jgi:hypothetical protein
MAAERDRDTAEDRGLGTAAAHGLAVTVVERGLLVVDLAVADSTVAVAAGSTAAVVDTAAADTGKLSA